MTERNNQALYVVRFCYEFNVTWTSGMVSGVSTCPSVGAIYPAYQGYTGAQQNTHVA